MTNLVPFKVERTDCEINDKNGYVYRFIFSRDRPEGMAEVLFGPVTLYDCLPLLAQRYRELGLQPNQMIAHLNRFYPNGQGLPDDSTLMKQGVGTAALELIIADAKEVGARAMHFFSGRSGMIRFMEKKGFSICYPRPEDGAGPQKYIFACKLI